MDKALRKGVSVEYFSGTEEELFAQAGTSLRTMLLCVLK